MFDTPIQKTQSGHKSAELGMVLVTWNAQLVYLNEQDELRHGAIASVDRDRLVSVRQLGAFRSGVTAYHELERTIPCDWGPGETVQRAMAPMTVSMIMGRIVSIRGSDNRYFCAEPGGRIVRNRTSARYWEVFALIAFDSRTTTDVLLAEAVAINVAVTHGDGQSEKALGMLADALKRPWLPPSRELIHQRLKAVRAEILVDLGRWSELSEIVGPDWSFHGSCYLNQLVIERAAVDVISNDGVRPAPAPSATVMTEPSRIPEWIGFARLSDGAMDRPQNKRLVTTQDEASKKSQAYALPLRAWPDKTGGVIRQAGVVGGEYICFSADDGVFRYSRRQRDWFSEPDHPESLHVFTAPRPRERLHGLAVLVGGHPNYFHNIIEFMINYFYVLKLRALWNMTNRHAAQRLSQATLIVSEPKYNFHRELLQILDLGDADCYFLNNNRSVVCDELVLLPQAISATGNVRDISAVRWLQSCIWNKTERTNGPRRLYISRDDAGKRRVRNEEDVRKLVESYGFAFLRLSQLPLIEQFALFRGAEVVMGPHGAGFANLIATERPCTFVEFLPVGPPRWSYYVSLAEGLGHRYMAFETFCLNDDHDMIVDTTALETLLQSITPSQPTHDLERSEALSMADSTAHGS